MARMAFPYLVTRSRDKHIEKKRGYDESGPLHQLQINIYIAKGGFDKSNPYIRSKPGFDESNPYIRSKPGFDESNPYIRINQ